MGLLLARYVQGGLRLDSEVIAGAWWIGPELLAVGYSTLLPLVAIGAAVLRAFSLPAGVASAVSALFLAVPFALIACGGDPDDFAPTSPLVAFLWFALAHWLPFRAAERAGDSLSQGLIGLLACGRRAVRVWSLFTASFFLSVVFVLPLEPLLGLEMPSVDHGQHFMLIGMGVLYFVLNVLLDVLPVSRWIARAKRRDAVVAA